MAEKKINIKNTPFFRTTDHSEQEFKDLKGGGSSMKQCPNLPQPKPPPKNPEDAPGCVPFPVPPKMPPKEVLAEYYLIFGRYGYLLST
jgi:hypothetical protein